MITLHRRQPFTRTHLVRMHFMCYRLRRYTFTILHVCTLYTQPNSLDSEAPLSSENGNIGHLIDDAMVDIMSPTDAPPKATPRNRVHHRSKKKPSGSPSKAKMEIHLSGDNSVVMDFNSDSDEDDDDDILRDLMSHHRAQKQMTAGEGGVKGQRRGGDESKPASGKSMKQSGSDHGSIFSESDEDFCFVDAPTITKVVRTSS